MRCKICNNGFLRATVDRLLDEKMTHVGIQRYASDAGIDITSDIISRHSKHYQPPPEKVAGRSNRDFAIIIRDKALDQVDRGTLKLEDKSTVPGINAGLRAQAILDQREVRKTQQQSAELAYAIIRMLGGGGEPPAQLGDGRTIEGEYEDVTDEAQ